MYDSHNFNDYWFDRRDRLDHFAIVEIKRNPERKF